MQAAVVLVVMAGAAVAAAAAALAFLAEPAAEVATALYLSQRSDWGDRMKDVIADHAKDWLTLFLTGLGITFAPHEWIGGMFLALAAAAFAMRSDPEQDQRELWLVLLGAFLASHIAGLASDMWLPNFPVQVVMAAAGFFSRRATRFALRLAGMVEARGDRIADRLVDRALGPAPKSEDE
jgi:hypothetical protein